MIERTKRIWAMLPMEGKIELTVITFVFPLFVLWQMLSGRNWQDSATTYIFVLIAIYIAMLLASTERTKAAKTAEFYRKRIEQEQEMKNRLNKVDFPQPVVPTIATYSPFSIFRESPSITFGIDSLYRKQTLFNSMVPFISVRISFPSETSGEVSKIGLAISIVGLISATIVAILAKVEKAPATIP